MPCGVRTSLTLPGVPRSSGQVDPAAVLRGLTDRLDQHLNPRACSKAEGLWPLSGDGFDETRHFDGLEIVEGKLMAGCHAEKPLGRMFGAGLNAAKATQASAISG